MQKADFKSTNNLEPLSYNDTVNVDGGCISPYEEIKRLVNLAWWFLGF